MHDMIEVKFDNEYVSTPVPAWSVDFDSSRYPVTAYRVIKKADASEIEQLREALADIANIINPYEDGDTMQEIARAALKEKE